MPVVQTCGEDGKPVLRYVWPARYLTPTEEMNADLRGWRAEAVAHQEEMLAAQRRCGRDDREYARFFRDEAARAVRFQRAVKLMLPWLGNPDTGQTPERPILWPVELAEELDTIAGRLVIAHG